MSREKSSALSSTVNDLIRAAAGGDARNVTDEDLDEYVAGLMAKEAAERRKKYDQVGVRAYLSDPKPPPNTLPKTNKRFLLNMVKATDSHNKAIICQAERQAAERSNHRRTRYRSPDSENRHQTHRIKREKSVSSSDDENERKRRRRSRSHEYDAIKTKIPHHHDSHERAGTLPNDQTLKNTERSRRDSSSTDESLLATERKVKKKDRKGKKDKKDKKKKDKDKKEKKKRQRNHDKDGSTAKHAWPAIREWDLGKKP